MDMETSSPGYKFLIRICVCHSMHCRYENESFQNGRKSTEFPRKIREQVMGIIQVWALILFDDMKSFMYALMISYLKSVTKRVVTGYSRKM